MLAVRVRRHRPSGGGRHRTEGFPGENRGQLVPFQFIAVPAFPTAHPAHMTTVDTPRITFSERRIRLGLPSALLDGMKPFSRETIVDRRQPQLRWSAIFGGAVLAIGLWALLQILGTGLGLAAIDTASVDSAKGAGLGTGIWSLIAPLIAMFLAAFLTGRLSGSTSRKLGAMHGAVMWALATFLGLWAVLAIITSVVGAVANVSGLQMSAQASMYAVPGVSEKDQTLKALEAADATGKALLLGGTMMLLSLGAALGGGALGVAKWRDREVETRTTTTIEPTSPRDPTTLDQ